MATLEKIRKRSVLLFIVIIVALLAFILGDFISNGRSLFGPDKAAKVNGEKIAYEDYASRRTKEGSMRQGVDEGQLDEYVINTMINEALLNKEYEEMGLTALPEDISAEMGLSYLPYGALDEEVQVFLSSTCRDLNLQSPAELFAVVKNPASKQLSADQAKQLKAAWAEAEKAAGKAAQRRKYNTLLNQLYTANNVDAHVMQDMMNLQYQVTYAAADYSAIPDDEVSVSDEDLKKAYEQHKDRYRLNWDEERVADVILVPLTPSDADMAAVNAKAAKAIADLNAGMSKSDIKGFEKISDTVTDEQLTQTLQKIATQLQSGDQQAQMAFQQYNSLANALRNAKQGEAQRLELVPYTVSVLMVDTLKNAPADVNVNILATLDKEQADSLLVRTSGIKYVSELELNDDNVMSADTLKASLMNDYYMADAVGMPSEKILDMPLNEYALVEGKVFDPMGGSQDIYCVVKVNERENIVPVYSYTIYNAEISPSKETIAEVKDKLDTYLKDNGNAAKFYKNAAENGYNLAYNNVIITDATGTINGMTDTRDLIRKILRLEKDQKTPVMDKTKSVYTGNPTFPFGFYSVALLKGIYDDEYYPVEAPNVKDDLTQLLLAEKKAQKVADQYKDNMGSVAEFASAANTQPQTMPVSFSPYYSPKVWGAVAAANKGEVSAPVQDKSQVIVFTLDEVRSLHTPFDAKNMGGTMLNYILFDRAKALRERERVETHIYQGQE